MRITMPPDRPIFLSEATVHEYGLFTAQTHSTGLDTARVVQPIIPARPSACVSAESFDRIRVPPVITHVDSPVPRVLRNRARTLLRTEPAGDALHPSEPGQSVPRTQGPGSNRWNPLRAHLIPLRSFVQPSRYPRFQTAGTRRWGDNTDWTRALY
ncbi:hypothetical protein VUR80DRAFT_10231 [Thermomyces stellatus]